MDKPITKAELRTALGFETDADIAAFFDITSQAVCQWAEDDRIPELRWLQAQLKRPDIWPPAKPKRLRKA